MRPDDPRHGSTRGYHAGCREMCCRRAIALYEKAGRLARLSGGRAVPAIGAQRRLQALMALGWSSHLIAVEAGFTHRNHVWRVIRGQNGKPTTWLQKSTDEWVRDVYDRLSMHIPTGPYVTRTRTHAQKQGWLPPLAWDDIDDPDEQPDLGLDQHCPTDIDAVVVERVLGGDRLHMTRAERVEIVRQARVRGWSLSQIEKHCHIDKPERYIEKEVAA